MSSCLRCEMRMEHQCYLQPGKHKFLGREVTRSELVVGDQAPDESQDQLDVSVLNVCVSCGGRRCTKNWEEGCLALAPCQCRRA